MSCGDAQLRPGVYRDEVRKAGCEQGPSYPQLDGPYTALPTVQSVSETTVCGMTAVLIVVAVVPVLGLFSWLAFCFAVARSHPRNAVPIIEAAGRWFPAARRAKSSRRRA